MSPSAARIIGPLKSEVENAMFERQKNRPADTPSPGAGVVPKPASPARPKPAISRSTAMIGPSIEIKGSVTGDEDLVIEGTVEGTVELGSHQVTVGPSGKVNADIHAKVVNIDGEVSGDLNGGEKVIISKSGRVRGNIVAPRVLLEDGAIFKGSIDMDPGEPVKPAVAKAPKKVVASSEERPKGVTSDKTKENGGYTVHG